MMSKVVITNTTNAPVFASGRLLTCGASIEVFEYEVPDCLMSQVLATDSEADELKKDEGNQDIKNVSDEELAEDSLIAAAGKKK